MEAKCTLMQPLPTSFRADLKSIESSLWSNEVLLIDPGFNLRGNSFLAQPFLRAIERGVLLANKIKLWLSPNTQKILCMIYETLYIEIQSDKCNQIDLTKSPDFQALFTNIFSVFSLFAKVKSRKFYVALVQPMQLRKKCCCCQTRGQKKKSEFLIRG